MSRRQSVSHGIQDHSNYAEVLSVECSDSGKTNKDSHVQKRRMISIDEPIRIVDLDFSVPVYNALTRVNITTLGDLLRMGMEPLAQKIEETHYQNRWQQVRYEVQAVLARLDLLL